ncbi:hypothetical protein [uncultured Cohaesibacter sp.]|uniref:hypothetical protein n=1 Tax=uncultured Cohaesibacter sp. TaxID=1002546 RepID=UPI00292EF716|nr:hypothetical protein [uncultured Cohaesibacter sp.]
MNKYLLPITILSAFVYSGQAAASESAIKITNGCDEKARVILHVIDEYDEWHNYGFFTTEPGESGFPTDKNGDLIVHDFSKKYLYTYYETTDGRYGPRTIDEGQSYWISFSNNRHYPVGAASVEAIDDYSVSLKLCD